MRRTLIAVTLLLAVVAGVGAASVVSPGSAAEQPPGGRDELPAGSVQTGAPVGDPLGGPAWAVHVFDANTSWRCVMAGRTDGTAFGPVDAQGRVQDTGSVASGSCADPADEPSQVAVARYSDSGGSGPRSVLFGIVEPQVTSVDVAAPGIKRPVALDAARTFVVVADALWPPGDAEVTLTLKDGSSRSYRR